MRKIYLIRHGKAEKEPGTYIGVTDCPLSEEGIRQMQIDGAWLKHTKARWIASSDLSRTVSSAESLSEVSGLPYVLKSEAFREINLGSWEGKKISWIRSQFPEEYEQRGKAIGSYRIPDGESFEETADRTMQELLYLIHNSTDDFAIVTHSGVIRSLICRIRGISLDSILDVKMPEAGITVLGWNGSLSVLEPLYRPIGLMGEAEIRNLYQRCEVPEPLERHMKAVRDTCAELISELKGAYDAEALEKGALVHDLLRALPNHAGRTADLLTNEGWLDIADIVRFHDDEGYLEQTPLNEADLLYYADKITREDQRVSLAERFEASRAKCRSDEAMRHHDARYRKALGIEAKIQKEKRQVNV
ncbi:MAG: histidine phosphatase family protein [Bulleidia sp.]